MENPSPPPPNPALPYREDCWSEGATSTLIDAWGNRYLDLNRGNLRQKQWQEVADAVNSRRTAVKRPRRTDVQCKNRIDTLKKKYKSEKAKIAGSGGIHSSCWPFYDRLDALIGPAVAAKPSPPPLPMALPLPYPKNRNYLLPQAVVVLAKRPYPEEQILRKGNYLAAAAAAAKSAEEDSESFKSSPERFERSGWKEANGGEENSGDGMREVAKAIASFAEIYERVESDNQRLMVEVERQQMEFMKALEFQRMKMFVDMHVQLQKVKRTKRAVSGPAAVKHSYPDNQ